MKIKNFLEFGIQNIIEILNFKKPNIKLDNFFWFFGEPQGICLVSHIDTVFSEPQNKIVIQKKNIITSPDGLGADDRAGVFALLYLMQKLLPQNVCYLFTNFEEMGGQGASKACSQLNLIKIKYFIEIDLYGFGQSVFYNSENRIFKNYINKFGFVETPGTFSDISILGKFYNKPAVNLSAGYYRNHSKTEFLDIESLFYTISKTILLIKDYNNCKNLNFKISNLNFEF